MTQEITALRFQKRNDNRVNVYLDGEFAFGLAAIEATRLKVGQVLSEEDVARLKKLDEVERAYERGLNFLSYRPRSKAEVRRNLRNKEVDPEVIERVVERLTRAGLLDDLAFARYWLKNRAQFNPRGTRALRHELWEKGVDSSIVDQVLEDFDEEAAARKVAEAGASRLAHLSSRDFCRKLKGYMARRGFSYGIIHPLVQEMMKMYLPDERE